MIINNFKTYKKKVELKSDSIHEVGSGLPDY